MRGLVNKHVLQTGKHIFISEAGFHPICLSCPLTGQCFYKACIVYPIVAETEVIGTVSLTAFDDPQKEMLGSNTDSLIEFIGRMADLISSKALEREILAERVVLTNRLEAVVDSVDEGVVAVDRDGLITHFNRSADNFEGRKLHLLSTAKPIKVSDGHIAGAVATLRDFKETQRLAYEIMNTQEKIDFDDLVGASKSFLEVKNKAFKISSGNSTVLITGESGTGKELIARAIHAVGPYGHRPFISAMTKGLFQAPGGEAGPVSWNWPTAALFSWRR